MITTDHSFFSINSVGNIYFWQVTRVSRTKLQQQQQQQQQQALL